MNDSCIAVKQSLCPLCKSSKTLAQFHDLLKCNNCGIRFVDFENYSQHFNKIYEKEYFHGKVYRNYLKEEQFRSEFFKEKIKLIHKDLPESDRVLDIGCSMGFFLKVMQEKNYEPYGVEVSEYAAQLAQRNNNLNIYRGELQNIHFPGEFFDVIALWDVLEHLTNPLSVLAEINRILKKNGILIIETLNIDSLSVRILKHNWPLYYPPYHLIYYSAKTLKSILVKMKFVTIKIVPIQTYFRTHKGIRSFKYFRIPIIREILGLFFNDVIIFLAVKS